MSKTLEGMARAICFERSGKSRDCVLGCTPDTGCLEDMSRDCSEKRCAKALCLWLASNVTDKMVEALWTGYHANNGSGRHMLSAALRAAAGWGEK